MWINASIGMRDYQNAAKLRIFENKWVNYNFIIYDLLFISIILKLYT